MKRRTAKLNPARWELELSKETVQAGSPGEVQRWRYTDFLPGDLWLSDNKNQPLGCTADIFVTDRGQTVMLTGAKLYDPRKDIQMVEGSTRTPHVGELESAKLFEICDTAAEALTHAEIWAIEKTMRPSEQLIRRIDLDIGDLDSFSSE